MRIVAATNKDLSERLAQGFFGKICFKECCRYWTCEYYMAAESALT